MGRRQFQDVFEEVYTGSVTFDPANILDGDEIAQNITVTGAALGDVVLAVSSSIDVTDLVLDAQVTAANTVTAVLANNTGAAVNLGSTKVRIVVARVADLK